MAPRESRIRPATAGRGRTVHLRVPGATRPTLFSRRQRRRAHGPEREARVTQRNRAPRAVKKARASPRECGSGEKEGRPMAGRSERHVTSLFWSLSCSGRPAGRQRRRPRGRCAIPRTLSPPAVATWPRATPRADGTRRPPEQSRTVFFRTKEDRLRSADPS